MSDVENASIFPKEIEKTIDSIEEHQMLMKEYTESRNVQQTCNVSFELSDYSLWPKTFRRKEKRNSTSMPFVITDSGWKKCKNRNRMQKQNKRA